MAALYEKVSSNIQAIANDYRPAKDMHVEKTPWMMDRSSVLASTPRMKRNLVKTVSLSPFRECSPLIFDGNFQSMADEEMARRTRWQIRR